MKGNKSLIRVKIKNADIDFLTRVFEGYDGLGMVSTLDRKEGLVGIWVTPDTQEEVRVILEHFPRELEVQDQ